MKTLTMLSVSLILLAPLRNAHAQQWKDALTTYLNDARTNAPARMPQLHGVEAHEILSTLRQFADDSVSSVRIRVCEAAYSTARHSTDSSIRKGAVEILSLTCMHTSTDVQGIALNYLKSFPRADFSVATRKNIHTMVKTGHPYLKELIRLSAFLQLKELMPTLKSMTTQETQPAIRWASIISLARLGDERSAHQMMMRVRRLPVNDELVYNVFPDLVFSRHREAITYLIEVLNNDALKCISANADRELAIPCAYRVMEQLAGVIKDYPLLVDASGDIDTTDYPQALALVREWFRTNKTYDIDNQSY